MEPFADLSGRVAIVTGGGKGIGRSVCVAMAKRGAHIVVAARTKSEIDNTARQVEETGTRAMAIAMDLARPDDIRRLIHESQKRFGRIDILVNNAALNLTNSPADSPEADIDAMLDVNLKGLFLLCREAAEVMRGKEWGRIINISSVAADLGLPLMAIYGASKSGVKALTRALAVWLARDGITVNTVTPGVIATERIKKIAQQLDLFDLERFPLGRMGTAEEIASAVVFLASEEAGYITGADLVVDGGASIRSAVHQR